MIRDQVRINSTDLPEGEIWFSEVLRRLIRIILRELHQYWEYISRRRSEGEHFNCCMHSMGFWVGGPAQAPFCS